MIMLIFFSIRCREEHGPTCWPTEFHKPLDTLPKDAEYEAYKRWRFPPSIFAVGTAVAAPHLWLRAGGNLNGYSPLVVVAYYAPIFAGAATVADWALKGHALAAKVREY